VGKSGSAPRYPRLLVLVAALHSLPLDWDDDVGSSIRFADLQSFLVAFLPALQDVESDLRQFRNSPLARLIAAVSVAPALPLFKRHTGVEKPIASAKRIPSLWLS
jgi:hypothetical protein